MTGKPSTPPHRDAKLQEHYEKQKKNIAIVRTMLQKMTEEGDPRAAVAVIAFDELFPKNNHPNRSKKGQGVQKKHKIERPMILVMLSGQQRVHVNSFAEASEVYCLARDKSGLGASEWKPGFITDADPLIGEVLARVSYNGKVWPPVPWNSGVDPIYDPFDENPAAPQQQGNAAGKDRKPAT